MPHYGNYGCWKELSPRRRWYFHRCQVIRKITAGNHAALFITQLPGDKAEILHPLWKVIKCSNVVIQLIQTGREQNIPLIKEEKELWFCRFSQDAVCEALSFFHSLDYIFIPPFSLLICRQYHNSAHQFGHHLAWGSRREIPHQRTGLVFLWMLASLWDWCAVTPPSHIVILSLPALLHMFPPPFKTWINPLTPWYKS